MRLEELLTDHARAVVSLKEPWAQLESLRNHIRIFEKRGAEFHGAAEEQRSRLPEFEERYELGVHRWRSIHETIRGLIVKIGDGLRPVASRTIPELDAGVAPAAPPLLDRGPAQ